MAADRPGWVSVHGVTLELPERGQGRPILWLHGEDGLDPSAPFIDLLAAHGRVVAPSHPGFGHSPDANNVDSVDDLAYLYLDLLAERNLRDVIVIGSSLGGWIAAEMAVKSSERFGGLEGRVVAHVGDGNNVARSLAILGRTAGVEVRVAAPDGYRLEDGLAAMQTADPREAVEGADAVYTDVWVSMGDEEEAERRRVDLAPYQVNEELLGFIRS